MRRHFRTQVLPATVLLAALGLAPVAAAQPADTGGPVAAVEVGPPAGPASDACTQFGAALDHAASYYSDFADAIAGDRWTFRDANVVGTNDDARTALRQSAAAAMRAAGTPGLQPEIANPMRAWSLGATKLVLVMGLHGSGDRMNSAATELNTHATDTQMACAQAGTQA
ncbi:hypothetical protein AB0K11_08715 [Mycobacterium sp. NPDC050551]|uniref:hypothetical protein n=1 Tax=Mycobacterium sp. NPDC050551 TaxID=3155407 RepID=UPI003435759D